MLMEELFIPSSEFEVASNTVNKILRQPVEEIEITNLLPSLNDITDSNKVFYTKNYKLRDFKEKSQTTKHFKRSNLRTPIKMWTWIKIIKKNRFDYMI